MTQAQVAEAAGLAVETISRLEGGVNMTLDVAASIAAALGVPLAALFDTTPAPARTLTPMEERILSLVRGLDEQARRDVYQLLRRFASLRNPLGPPRRQRAARR